MRKSIVLLAMTTWLSFVESEGCDALAANPQESSPPVTARAAVRTGQLSPDGAPPVFNVTESSCAASHGASLPIALAVLAVVLRRRRDPASGEAGHQVSIL